MSQRTDSDVGNDENEDADGAIGGPENRIEEWRDRADCPGMGVAVVDGEETVLAAGFGERQIEPARAATADTLFGIGSATKPVTATAVLTLVDRGDIALEDPVPEYVAFFEDAPGDPITVHELLSHTSGMPADDLATLLLLQGVFGSDVGPPLDDSEAVREYVEGATDRRLVDDDRFLYYNAGYVVLTRLVEAVSGRPFPEYVERNVFDPLGIEDAAFDPGVVADDARDAMTPYRRMEDGGFRAASLPEASAFRGPGGLVASTSALASFLSWAIEGDGLLDDDLRERMFESVAVQKRLVDGTEYGYGYGWETRPFGDDVLVGHSGSTGVSAGYLGFLRDRGLGVAIGCNAPPTESPEHLAIELLASLTGRDPATVAPQRAVERAAKPVTGRYESYQGLQSATVKWTASGLEVEYENPLDEETWQFAPASLDPEDREFVALEEDGTRTTAEFRVGDDGIELILAERVFHRVDT